MAQGQEGGYDNTNRGVLFKNNDPRGENSPTYRGSADVLCTGCGQVVEHWVSAWVKTSRKDGSKFFSLSFQPKDEQHNHAGGGGGGQRGGGQGAQRDTGPSRGNGGRGWGGSQPQQTQQRQRQPEPAGDTDPLDDDIPF